MSKDIEVLQIGEDIASRCVPLIGIESDDAIWHGDMPDVLAEAISMTMFNYDMPNMLSLLIDSGALDDNVIDLLEENESLVDLMHYMCTMTIFRTAQRIAGELHGCLIDGSKQQEQLIEANKHKQEEKEDDDSHTDMYDAAGIAGDNMHSWGNFGL